MTMIKILEAPTQNERHKFVSFPNLNGSHQFNLDNYDIRIYYHKLFDNRTSKDKLYIDKYNSLDELEEDVIEIEPIYKLIKDNPDKTKEEIYKMLDL